MKILITGSKGFIGRNLKRKLLELGRYEIFEFNRGEDLSILDGYIKKTAFIFHIAGENRSKNCDHFVVNNIRLTELIAGHVENVFKDFGRKIPIIFTSSVKVESNDNYGKTKKAAEDVLTRLNKSFEIPIYIFRLPNIFGKWSRPDHNSVVATFSYKIARSIPINIVDAHAEFELVHVDTVVDSFVRILKMPNCECAGVQPHLSGQLITVKHLADLISDFQQKRNSCDITSLSNEFIKQLYSTYLTYVPNNDLAFRIPQHTDERGRFVELFKSSESGQISYFTIKPGMTRGGHYHHLKVERFCVVHGKVVIKQAALDTEALVKCVSRAEDCLIFESRPGWVHEFKNVGDTEAVIIVWSNEIYNLEKPDTYSPFVEEAKG